MKKFLKIVFLFSLALFCLCGCASLKQTKPFWYYAPNLKVDKSQISFVGEGVAETEEAAETLAYSDIFQKIKNYVGKDLSDNLYNELINQGFIEEISYVSIEYDTKKTSDGIRVIILGASDKEKLDSIRTPDAAILEDKIDKAISLILEGDEYIKKNMDLEAVRCYLKSMVITHEIDYIEEEYSYKVIYAEVRSILESIYLSISDENPSLVTCTITAKRKQSIIPSNVKNCYIVASYNSVDGKGNSYPDSFSYMTSEKGSFSYMPLDYSLSRNGSIVFEFDLNDEISAIEAFDSYSALKLRRIVQSKSISFNYSRDYQSGPIVISAMSYSLEGSIQNSNVLTGYLKKMFDEENADCDSYIFDLDLEEDEMAEKIKELFPNSEYTMILKAGACDNVVSQTGTQVLSIEAKVFVYNLKTLECEYQSDVFYSNGFGETYQEAMKNSFDAIAELAYTLVRNTYV